MNQPSQLLSEKIDRGIKQAVADAVEKHRKLGQAIAVWRDGEVVILPPDEIPNLERESI